MIPITQITKAELVALAQPKPVATDPVVMVVAMDEYTLDDEVNESNYRDFLPDYSVTPAHITSLLTEDGLGLTPEAQAEWDEPPPALQDGYEEGRGA